VLSLSLAERRAALANRRNRLRRSSAPAIGKRRGEAIKVSATEAKETFGGLLDSVLEGGTVLITKHGTPKAVLLSMEDYGALSRATQTRLDALNREFDAMLMRMQTRKARAGMKAAFAALPKQLGKAALALKGNRRKLGRKVRLPLVRSKRPGTLHLDNAKIYELISFP
jgi:antitoxin Phd